MATAESAKTCVVCGKDVAGKPRVKDAAGKYMCAGECQQKAMAAAKARPAAAPAAKPAGVISQAKAPLEPGGLLGQLIDDSPMLKAAKCESCGSAMPGGSVICTRCGFNTQTGKALKTAVIVEKEKKEKKTGGARSGAGLASNGWLIFGVAGFIALAAGFTPMIDMDLALPGFFALVVLGFAALITACSAVHEEGSDFMIGVFIALRVGTRYLARMGGGVPLIAGIVELGLVAYVLIFVENRMAKALTAAAFIGWLTFGFCVGLQGKTIESVLNF